MTPKDLRDIAAYWGAPCRISVDNEQLCDTPVTAERKVDERLFSLLRVSGVGFKLRLRPLSSLTDEEVRNVVDIVSPDTPARQIVRTSETIEYSESYPPDVCIFFDKWFILYGDGGGASEPLPNVPQAVAYLQSIAVHVPGTISQEYVELIP